MKLFKAKKLLLSSISLYFFILLLFSCGKKETALIATYSKIINKTQTIESGGDFNIRLSDITTQKSFYVRKVELINKNDSSDLDSFIITVKCLDSNINILNAIKSKTFTGFMQISSDGETLLNLEMKDGALIEAYSIESQSNEFRIKTSFIPTCKFNLIHGCVSQHIKNMGFLEYSLCLYNAPECYGGLWAICALNYCIKGELK